MRVRTQCGGGEQPSSWRLAITNREARTVIPLRRFLGNAIGRKTSDSLLCRGGTVIPWFAREHSPPVAMRRPDADAANTGFRDLSESVATICFAARGLRG